ncbi:hypothetical protein [Pseudoalteromonas sp. McH1-42]|uniref:hypothetical protein n=1 Tax=Pseudoalteromonas sp. McH1-42 TaxID=2917752 RepID=UPI001EF52A9D|nr:hypothetical protein [Pseudoalteromonas sp. McH1-42]MCG7563102.1 hypothetical protein [Pseudoalteromonas sp. McH1-42]
MKTLAFFTALVFFNLAHAECTKEQNQLKIQIDVIGSISDRLYKNDNHPQMNRIVVSAPVEVEGFKIQRMDLTKGEVAEFWFPISYEVKNNNAETVLQGYPSNLENLEMVITYSNEGCTRVMQKLL